MTMTCDDCDAVFHDGIDAGQHEIETGHRVGWTEHNAAREAQDEALIDGRVQSRLRSDRAYLWAENAEEQAEREREIEDEEIRHLADYRARLRAKK